MPKFLISETIYSERVQTVRGGTIADKHGSTENGKATKLSVLDNHVLCAAGDAIESIQGSSHLENQGTSDGYAIIGVYSKGYKNVTFEGAALVPGDFVVVGTVTPLGTKQAAALNVVKAPDQAAAKVAPFKARVVSLGDAGTGAAGTRGVIEML